MKKFNKGFTLIELLVVIAIIGILASVVLASLNSARQKGSNAAVQADMANMRAQAELYYSNQTPTNTYNAAGATSTAITDCATGVFGDPNITAAIANITAQSNAPTCATDSAGQHWAIMTTFKDGVTKWCVDNSSHAGTGFTAVTAGVCTP